MGGLLGAQAERIEFGPVSPRRCAIRSAATYWFGKSMSQVAGRGVPQSAPMLDRSGTRLIASTPQATPALIASAAMSPAIRCTACCAEPHWASKVKQPVCCGSPACSQAVRVMFAGLLADGMPNIPLAGQAERLRSGWLNGIKALPVSYRR